MRSTYVEIEKGERDYVAKIYRCPKCNGSIFIWDPEINQYVCPKDETPLLEFIPEDDVSEID